VTHSREHEAVLLRCLDQADPRAALLASEVVDCGECAEKLEELVSVRKGLDALGRDFRERTSSGPGAGEHLVDEVLGPLLARRAWGRRLSAAALVLAAAAALLWGWVILERSPAPAPGPMLGVEGVELLSPLGEVTAFGDFTWRGTPPRDGWFEIRVLDTSARELARGTTESNRWTSESTADWPKEIVWRLSVHEASGASRGTLEGRAWLSSR